MIRKILLTIIFAVSFNISHATHANDHVILVQSTTSTANSGLFDYILPKFQLETGITAKIIAVGTGQAIQNARNGDGDLLLVHSTEDEIEFVRDGHGIERFDLMYNDFVMVGPATDPAGILGEEDVTNALKKIADKASIFISRSDQSGTHKKEQSLWKQAKITPKGDWYREAGNGMGATLNIAVAMNGYTISDRATWIAFGNKQNHRILVEGDPRLFNQYGVIAVNPKRHPHVNINAAQNFINWLLGTKGQSAINAFKLDNKQLFFANAKTTKH